MTSLKDRIASLEATESSEGSTRSGLPESERSDMDVELQTVKAERDRVKINTLNQFDDEIVFATYISNLFLF